MSKKHLLVVDDEEALRSMLTDFLGAQGYRVTPIQSAAEAMAILSDQFFDLAIIDLVMPAVDGFDLLDMIRDEHPRLPVVVFTGVGFDEEILQEAREKGASSFLTKGLPLGNLLMEIHRLLNYPPA